uniref:YfhO family protein n=1 Tax=Staphylococcus aureus TaxID=1280 RepID=UPI00115A1017
VFGLNTKSFEKAISAVQEKGVDLTTGKRSASGTFTADKDQVLVTTIPYDKGWRVKIDGKKVTPKAFKDAFLSVPVSAGTHTIQFSYLPEGLIPGIVLFVLCTGGFVAYVTLIPARRNRKKEDK